MWTLQLLLIDSPETENKLLSGKGVIIKTQEQQQDRMVSHSKLQQEIILRQRLRNAGRASP